jgi:hypothetical protein
MMIKFAIPFLCLALLFGSGCSQLNPSPGDGQVDWDRVNRSVENMTELTALIAFARDDVKPHKEAICTAVAEVAPVLENFNDPDATFEKIRGVALNAVKEIPSDVLPDGPKQIAVLVVDQVLDVVFLYTRDSYTDLVNRNEAQVALSVAKSVANGLNSACGSTVSAFSTDRRPTFGEFGQFNVDKK